MWGLLRLFIPHKLIRECAINRIPNHWIGRGISITGVPGKNDQIFSAAFNGKGKPIQCTEYVCTCDSRPLYTADRINNENNNKLEQDVLQKQKGYKLFNIIRVVFFFEPVLPHKISLCTFNTRSKFSNSANRSWWPFFKSPAGTQ